MIGYDWKLMSVSATSDDGPSDQISINIELDDEDREVIGLCVDDAKYLVKALKIAIKLAEM